MGYFSVRKFSNTLKRVNMLEPWARQCKDHQLKEEMLKLRRKIREGIAPEKLMDKGFALIREATRRVLNKRQYDVQIMGGIGLVSGNVIEMATGEGKTLVAILPACIHGLSGDGAHVVTVNPYLAQRDFELTAPIYRMLGLTVGLLRQQDPPAKKRRAYQCDVTYGVSHAFGFDYLNDQLQLLQNREYPLGLRFLSTLAGTPQSDNHTLQRGHAFALIDEVDSILIDEARSPLVISGAKQKLAAYDAQVYKDACSLAAEMEQGVDYQLDFQKRNLELTPWGLEKIQKYGHPYNLKRPWHQYVEQALRACIFYRKDVEYILDDQQKIVIVDEFTGRRFAERNWQDGLHQAIEAKEGVPVTHENRSLARITRQRYFNLYKKLAGMTGTVANSSREFREIYHLTTMRIPLRKPLQREIWPPRMFTSWDTKWRAIVQEIVRIHNQGRPILIGTRTIEQSEEAARRLQKLGLQYQLLNAKQDSEEAKVISQAGQEGRITIATNMAGRGADIPLSPEVAKKGGLHVIAVERHESKRIDDQLAGRCARQGEPGSFQFFVSCEDVLFDMYAPKMGKKLQGYADQNGELPARYYNHFDKLQQRVELEQLDIRKKLLHYDTWLQEVMEAL